MTDELERRLLAAAQHKMTPAEIQQQRISFVFGNLPDASATTREEVTQMDYARHGNLVEMEAEIARLRADLAAAREREAKWVVSTFGSDSARADLHEKLKEVKADLAAAREQVAGAYLAAADTAYLWHDDDDAQELREMIRKMTTSDATAALEARDARVRAEERERIHKIIRKCADEGDISYGAAQWIIDALRTPESRKAGGE